MQRRGEKHADALRAQQPEVEISGPIMDVGPNEGAVGRVAQLLNRQDRIVGVVNGQFSELFAKLKQKNPTLSKPSLPAQQVFSKAASDIRGEAMMLSVKKARQADGATGQASQDLNDEVDAEIARLKKAFDTAANAAVAAVRDAGATDASLEEAIKAALLSEQDDTWRKKFEDGKRKMQGAIDILDDWGARSAPALQARLDAITDDDLAQAVGDLAELWTDGQAAREDHQKDYLDARVELEKNHKAVQERRTALANSDAYSALSKTHKAELKQQLAMISNIMASGLNTATFASAQMVIDDCTAMIKDFETGAEKVSEFKNDISRIEKALNDSSNKKARPAHNARLTEALDKLNAGWKEMSLTKAVLAAKTLLGQTILDDESYEKLCVARIEWRKAKKDQVKALHQLLKKMDKVMAEITKGEIKKFNGDIFNSLAGIEAGIASETSDMDALNLQLTRLETQIQGWVDGPITPQMKSDIYVDNAEGVAKTDAQEAAKVAVKAAYKLMESDLTTSAKNNTLNSVKQEYKDIASFLKSAKDLMKDPEGYDQAQAIIDRSRSRMEAAEVAAPKIPISELKLLHKAWGEAVAGTRARVGALKDAVEAKAGVDESGKSKLDAQTQTALVASLKDAADLMDPSAFNYASGLYAASEAGKGTVKQAREETLRRIHVLKEIVANDPVLKKAAENPFGVGGVLKPVYDELRHFEYIALIGV